MSSLFRLLTMLALTASIAAAGKVRTDGTAPGEFTMDFDAAKAVAKEKNLPILIDFTGSDWCGWCKIMDKNVFGKPEWAAYAKDKLVLVTIDFPQNESIVPAKWRERNEELSAKYKVEGFPTYVILDSKAEKELGRLGAGRTKTPESFAKEVDGVIKKAAAAPAEKEAKPTVAETDVTPGSWTTDLDAAKAYAKEHDKPIFVNFTGSDWCYWCKVMHKNVFAKDEFSAWAKDNVVLVEIDFPSDKSKQSKELRAANRKLQKAFNVRGYPTFVVLKSDGTTEAGRLGAGRDKTPESFIKEVNALLTPQPAAEADDKPATETAATGDHSIMTDGAEPGKWTMDLEAAKTLAGQKGLPVFLDFTGSDWCGWCKLMQKNVFNKPEFSSWAKDNLVLVTIDFPKDKTKVPEAFQVRNRDLQKQYGVRGYPTYVILDPANDKELGRLGAGRDKTPSTFIKEVEQFLMFVPSQVEKYAATLDGDAAKAYLDAHAAIDKAKKDMADAEKRMEAAKKAMHDIRAGKTTEPAAEEEVQDADDKDQTEAEDNKPAPAVAAAADDHDHGVMTDSHVAGRWTMDYDAALTYAKENNKPVLINFTGSDWCGWCKLMDKNVFAAADWSAYARKNLALVTVDFPNDKSIVPKKYVERNGKLKDEHGVRGYPTYVLISANGDEIGRLGAGRDKTPASFAAEVDALLSLTPAGIDAYVKDLNDDQATAYRTAIKALQTAQTAERDYQSKAERTPEGMKKMMALNADVGLAEDALRQLKANHAAAAMGDKSADYLAAHKSLTEARQKLRDFLADLPEQNDENTKRFTKINEAIKEAQSKVDSY